MEYPYIEPTPKGLIVHMSKGAKLPGVYLDYLQAEKAIKKYQAKAQNAKRQTKKK